MSDPDLSRAYFAPTSPFSAREIGSDILPSIPHSSLDVLVDPLTALTDEIATALKLNEEYRADLHYYKEMTARLPLDHARTQVFTQATIYQTQQLITDFLRSTEFTHVKEVMESVRAALSHKIQLSPGQKDEVLSTCKVLLFKPGRTDFKLVDEVINNLKQNKKNNGFEAVFSSAARVKDLRSSVGRQVSYAKYLMRGHVRDSLYHHNKKSGLSACTSGAGKKFLGGSENAGPQHVMYMAIYRAFARENKDLVNAADESDNESGAEGIVGEERARKRKRGHGQTGYDFWSHLTQFFAEKTKEWGSDVLKSPSWKNYIDRCIAEERELFPNDRIPLLPTVAPVPAALPANSILGHFGRIAPVRTLDVASSSHSANDAVLDTSISSNVVTNHNSLPVPRLPPLASMSSAPQSGTQGKNTPRFVHAIMNA